MASRNRRTAHIAALRAVIVATSLACGDGTGPSSQPTPHGIVMVSGDAQTFLRGADTIAPLRVRVIGSDARTLAGATVRWAVTQGEAALDPAQSTTSANGEAQTRLTLAATTGMLTVSATVANVEPVTFSLTVLDPCHVDAIPTVALNTTVMGTLRLLDCGFPEEWVIDAYAFTIASQQAVRIRTHSDVFEPTTLMWIDPEGGAPRANSFFSHAPNNEAFIKAILPAGDYAAGVGGEYRGSTGAYDLLVSTTAADVIRCEDVWVVRGITTAQQLASDDCVNTTGPHYRDRFLIRLHAGEGLSLTQSSDQFAPHLIVLSWEGELIAEAQRSNPGPVALYFTASEDVALYIIFASSVTAQQSGAYTLAVSAPSAAVASSAAKAAPSQHGPRGKFRADGLTLPDRTH